MIRILLIRHGETVLLGRTLYGRMPGVVLSAQGYKQAECLAEVLKMRYQITELVSSPMERTQETARFISRTFSLPLTIDDHFNEIHFGAWMGREFSELREMEEWQEYNRHRSLSAAPGGESMLQVQTRAWLGIQAIAERHAGDSEATVAIVTHGDVVRFLLMLILGMPGDHIGRIEIAPGSVSEVIFHGLHPRLICMNQTLSPIVT